MTSRRSRRTVLWSTVAPLGTLVLFWWAVRSGAWRVLAQGFSQWVIPFLLPHLQVSR